MPFYAHKERPVLLVGFQEQDNLGLGYVASRLMYDGFGVKIMDYRDGKEAILERIREFQPLVVGFSVIFQYHIFEFRNMLGYLRDHQVKAHFTAGGHYPSLRYRELFEMIPLLDSIVLFEGEHTFRELVEQLYRGEEWRHLKGVAWHENGSVHANPLRELEADLDEFPIPVRPPLKEYALGHRFATLIAGRGCVYNCSFCSIREFYSKPPGSVKRIRRPALVVEEMKYLYDAKGCTVFMFQDDDFPVYPRNQTLWLDEFCQALVHQGLKGKIIWKINCRPDEISAESLKLMHENGLFQVYLGIENGTDDGLRRMNKHIDRKGNTRAVEILKKEGVGFDFGFMLFTPWSTLTSVAENLEFLREICSDGVSPVTFCKMLPYAETAVEKELAADNRLIGETGQEDYRFEEAWVDQLFEISARSFSSWLESHDGVLNMARWANYHLSVYHRFFPPNEAVSALGKAIRAKIAASNNYLIDRMCWLVSHIRDLTPEQIPEIELEISRSHKGFRDDLEGYLLEINRLAGRL